MSDDERLRAEVSALERWLQHVGWGPRTWTRRRDSQGVKRPVRLTLLERVAGFAEEVAEACDRWEDAPPIEKPQPHPDLVPDGHRWDECGVRPCVVCGASRSSSEGVTCGSSLCTGAEHGDG